MVLIRNHLLWQAIKAYGYAPVYMLLMDKAYRLVFATLQILTSAGKMCHLSMPYHSLAVHIKISTQHMTAHIENICRMYVILDPAIFKLGEFRFVQYYIVCYDKHV